MITQYKRLIKKMQNPTENSIPSNPSNPIEISDNEDINYQINTTSTKNQNRKNVELPYQKSSTSSIGNNDFKVQIDKLTEEKKALMESLKNEMIYNEEQRNYTQILKETIESNLYKSGLEMILNKEIVIDELGAGSYGKVYKISVENCKPFVIKFFFSDAGGNPKCGPLAEIPLAICQYSL